MLNKYVEEYSISGIPEVDVINNILIANGMDNHFAFWANFAGIIIIDLNKIQDPSVFLESVVLNKKQNEILMLFDSPAVHINKNAVRYVLNNAKSLNLFDMDIINKLIKE